MPDVLIVGAGIAGDLLAVLLDRAGWQVTVIDTAPGLRSGGQTVDLRGRSRVAAANLGLAEQIDRVTVRQAGIAWVDADGARLAQMPVTAFGGRGFVSDKELLRTDLAQLIHGAGTARIDYRWADTVTELRPASDDVIATFRSGGSARFDLVVGADGTHSIVRSLVFGDEGQFRRRIGLAHAWFTMIEQENTPQLDSWFLVHNAPGSRVVGARPGHSGCQEIGFAFPDVGLPERHDRNRRLDHLERVFAGVGWRAAELVLSAGAATDFAVDTSDQIRVPKWSSGRVVLLGDSAWCASPLSGLGTALALQGASALAEELTTIAPDVQRNMHGALDRYERVMRPITDRAQRLPPGRVRSFAPRTTLGIRCVAQLMTVLQRQPFASIAGRLSAAQGT